MSIVQGWFGRRVFGDATLAVTHLDVSDLPV